MAENLVQKLKEWEEKFPLSYAKLREYETDELEVYPIMMDFFQSNGIHLTGKIVGFKSEFKQLEIKLLQEQVLFLQEQMKTAKEIRLDHLKTSLLRTNKKLEELQ